MPRFTIVAHDHPFDHWDLFLEAGPILRTWRLIPRLDAVVTFSVEPTPDHRLHYLEYEGPIAGGRGNVKLVDTGTFAWDHDGPDRTAVHLSGTRFAGLLVLSRSANAWSGRFCPKTPT
jgi:hypothetical protein